MKAVRNWANWLLNWVLVIYGIWMFVTDGPRWLVGLFLIFLVSLSILLDRYRILLVELVEEKK